MNECAKMGHLKNGNWLSLPKKKVSSIDRKRAEREKREKANPVKVELGWARK